MIVPVKTSEKGKNIYKEWLVFVLNVSIFFKIYTTLFFCEETVEKTSWMKSDDVSNLAIKRMMYLVWRSNWSALMILCSSVLGESSYGVFWMRLMSLWLYLVIWLNSRIGILTSCRNLCGLISGRDLSTLKILIKGSFEDS